MLPIRCLLLAALALVTGTARSPQASAQETSPGLPVDSDVVRRICGPCHDTDDAGRMSRISYERKTPEGWAQTVKRMLRAGHAFAEPEEAREIVRYLADHHGLAPSEARVSFYRAEKRPTVDPIGDREIEGTCATCHMGGWFLSERRTAEEWRLLKGMHLGYFPMTEFIGFTGINPLPPGDEAESPAEPPGEGQRVDRVLAKLAERLPFDSPEWRAWQAKSGDRDIAGRWLLLTYQPGQGHFTGEVEISRAGRDWVTETTLHLRDGSREERTGRGVLYAGYSWRGSSSGSGDGGLGELKEVLMLAEDGARFEGRFFKGAFGELGFDVTLTRVGSDPTIAATWPRGLAAGSRSAAFRILGANLPQDIGPEHIHLGPGIEVDEIATRSAHLLELRVTVEPDALPGLRDASLANSTLVNAFAVYDRIDYLDVRPNEGLARLGGVAVPKQLIQFEALAYHRGLDDQPLTADDIDLGPVTATWSLEEYHVRPGDDDLDYVGDIDQSGLFVPNIDGPNPERGTNNFGDVWVVARYTPEAASAPLKGRAHLLVTVPLLSYWDPSP